MSKNEEWISDIHTSNLDVENRIIYLQEKEDTSDSPGVDFRMVQNFTKNINILQNISNFLPAPCSPKSARNDAKNSSIEANAFSFHSSQRKMINIFASSAFDGGCSSEFPNFHWWVCLSA